MGFIEDLVNRPNAAIETIKENRNKLKSAILIAATGFLLLINFFFAHFTGGFPQIIVFALLLGVVGMILMLFFVLGYSINLYLFLKLTKYKPAGDVSKTVAWCFLIPMLIFQGCFLVINVIFRLIGLLETMPYLYDMLRYLLYIWVIGLSVVAVIQNKPEHKFRNVLGVIGIFSLNWAIWVGVNLWFFQFLFTSLVV